MLNLQNRTEKANHGKPWDAKLRVYRYQLPTIAGRTDNVGNTYDRRTAEWISVGGFFIIFFIIYSSNTGGKNGHGER